MVVLSSHSSSRCRRRIALTVNECFVAVSDSWNSIMISGIKIKRIGFRTAAIHPVFGFIYWTSASRQRSIISMSAESRSRVCFDPPLRPFIVAICGTS